jgi:hypothetical protein
MPRALTCTKATRRGTFNGKSLLAGCVRAPGRGHFSGRKILIAGPKKRAFLLSKCIKPDLDSLSLRSSQRRPRAALNYSRTTEGLKRYQGHRGRRAHGGSKRHQGARGIQETPGGPGAGCSMGVRAGPQGRPITFWYFETYARLGIVLLRAKPEF